jgi:hypothetical protein
VASANVILLDADARFAHPAPFVRPLIGVVHVSAMLQIASLPLSRASWRDDTALSRKRPFHAWIADSLGWSGSSTGAKEQRRSQTRIDGNLAMMTRTFWLAALLLGLLTALCTGIAFSDISYAQAPAAMPAQAPAVAAAIPPACDAKILENCTFNSGDTAWMMTSVALVLVMTVPGLGLFYGGMVRKKNVGDTVMTAFAITCLVTVLFALITTASPSQRAVPLSAASRGPSCWGLSATARTAPAPPTRWHRRFPRASTCASR